MCLKTEHLFLYVYRLCNSRVCGSEFSAHHLICEGAQSPIGSNKSLLNHHKK